MIYTASMIMEMRRAIEMLTRQYEGGPHHAIYRPAEPSVVEDQLRTYIAAQVQPDELVALAMARTKVMG